MMRKKAKYLLFLSCLCAASLAAAEVGVVNFSNCVAESKLGKAEQANFEGLKKQLGGHLEQTEKELNELVAKLNDSEYMDGLSPEAEAELKEKAQNLSNEMGRYQNQYNQILNQANMKIVQLISTQINLASEQVAKAKKLDVILNKDACFFYVNSLDVTPQVITEMDKTYDQDQKKAAEKAQAASQASPEAGKKLADASQETSSESK